MNIMRILAFVAAILAPAVCSAQTNVYGEVEVNGAVYADVLNDAGMWLDAADASSKTTSGGDVTAWDCKVSGSSFTSGADNDPSDSNVTVDGATLESVRFDSGNTESLEASFAPVTDYVCTIFIAIKPDLVGYQVPFRMDVDAGPTGRNINVFLHLTPDVYLRLSDDAATGITPAAGYSYAVNELLVVSATSNGSNSFGVNVDASHSGTDTTSLSFSDALDTSIIGKNGRADNNYYSGHVLEILVFPFVMSAEERLVREDYLWRKWVHDPGPGIAAAGLVLDLDATVSSTITDAGAGKVSAWANRANKGSVSSVTQSVSADRPTTGGSINSLNAITFDRSALENLDDSNAVVTGAPCSFLVVAQSDGTANDQTVASVVDESAVSHNLMVQLQGAEAGDPASWHVRAGGTAAAPSAGAFDTNACVAGGVEVSSSSRYGWFNGSKSSENTTSTTPTGIDGTSIGSTAGKTDCMGGDIGRVLAWKRALLDREMSASSGALGRTWGVSTDCVLPLLLMLLGVRNPRERKVFVTARG